MILAADFDGTIFIDGKVSAKDIRAIRDFQASGNLFAIVTGRSFASLTPLIEGKIKPDSLICNNGGHIFVKDKNELREVLKAEIHPDKARDFLKFYENKIDNQLAIFTESAKINNLENINESIMALAIYSDDEIVNHFPEDFDFHYSIGVIDVVKKGINKQGGIDFIKDYYSFNGEIIAIGDDYNDIDFLKNTPLSYTLDYVTNEAVREVCNYSVKSVADLIENLMEGI